MKRMKTFFKYFLAIVIIYIIGNIISFYALKSTYNTKEYSVQESILDIEVLESKATFVNGYIKGKVKNNTDAIINNKYLKIDSYSKRGVLLGSKYIKLKELNPGEVVDFESSFNYEQIDNIKIDIIDENDITQGNLDFGFDNPDDAKITLGILLGAFILLIDNGFTWVLIL